METHGRDSPVCPQWEKWALIITADPRLLLHSFGGTNEFVFAASRARAFDEKLAQYFLASFLLTEPARDGSIATTAPCM